MKDVRGAPAPHAALRAAATGLHRRGFLRLAGAGAAAAALPLGCGDAPPALGPPPDAALRVLAPRTYATFNAATRRLVGPAGAALVDRGAVDPAALADAWLAELGPVARDFAGGLWLLELGVWPLLPKWRPFTALEGPGQDAVLRDLMRSRLSAKRRLFGALKTFGCLAHYAQPASHGPIGYPGPFGGAGVTIADAMTHDDL